MQGLSLCAVSVGDSDCPHSGIASNRLPVIA
jgi:hypothetical protein